MAGLIEAEGEEVLYFALTKLFGLLPLGKIPRFLSASIDVAVG